MTLRSYSYVIYYIYISRKSKFWRLSPPPRLDAIYFYFLFWTLRYIELSLSTSFCLKFLQRLWDQVGNFFYVCSVGVALAPVVMLFTMIMMMATIIMMIMMVTTMIMMIMIVATMIMMMATIIMMYIYQRTGPSGPRTSRAGWIIMQCLFVTKNHHFLLGVSCNHLNHP